MRRSCRRRFRMGILAALRSLSTGSVVGLMITASHNQVSDNGVKIADPSGVMMTQDWEPFADGIAYAVDAPALVELIIQFMKHERFMLGGGQAAEVILGTQGQAEKHFSKLQNKVSVPLLVLPKLTWGVLTTPQLHWMVQRKNKGLEASEAENFSQLSRLFGLQLMGQMALVIKSLKNLINYLKDWSLRFETQGKEGVGADYVQKERVAPSGFDLRDMRKRCASVDGDADRLVYFHILNTPNKRLALVDGDKILSLFALYVKEHLDILGETVARLGIVQTAYANGPSTDFLKHNGLEVVVTPTGVKYLHEKAAEYDIGIYF